MIKLISNKALKKIEGRLLKRLRSSVSVDLGSLKKSIKFSHKVRIKETIIEYKFHKYGIYVDKGTKPHYPPIKPITGWAKRKGINPYALQHHIGKYGTKPHPWLIEELDKKDRDIIDKDVINNIETYLKKKFEKK